MVWFDYGNNIRVISLGKNKIEMKRKSKKERENGQKGGFIVIFERPRQFGVKIQNKHVKGILIVIWNGKLIFQ